MKAILIFSLLVFSCANQISATPQRPNILLYEGKEYPLLTDPLESYFEKFPDRNPKRPGEQHGSLYRGYMATFEIDAGQLFLKEITIGFSSQSALAKVSPDKKG